MTGEDVSRRTGARGPGAAEFRPSGDTGLTIVLGHQIDPPTRARVLCWRNAIDAAQLTGVTETVPAYTSVLVHYDPTQTTQDRLIAQVRALDADAGQSVSDAGRRWVFPFCADGAEFAPDLPGVAEVLGLSPEAVLEMVQDADQTVYMLGFAPGQPYLGDLPDRLSIPRRARPVPSVPAGSVLTATSKTVVYPVANPTGWHVIGHCPVPLFDPTAEEPVLLAPGDRVRFRRVSPAEHREIAAELSAGGLDPVRDMRA